MENVPHLSSFAESLVARAIQRNFEALDYCVYHELLEAGEYGVPQARRRLFFIGTRIGWVYRWPRATHGKHGKLPRMLTLADAIADLPPVPAPSLVEERPYCPRERPGLKVSSDYAQLMRSTMPLPQRGLLFDHVVRPVREDDAEIFRSMQPGGRYRDVDPRYRRYEIKKVSGDEYFADRYYRLRWDQPCVTITAHMAKDGYRYIYPDNDQLRTLSVREAARVQSFPDHFRFAGYRSSRFRQIGNAVPPLLARAIGDSIARRIRDYRQGSLEEHVWQPPLPGLGRPSCSGDGRRHLMTDADAHAAFFRGKILEWGIGHRRDFPWRATAEPYRVLIAEMMLRRTRAEQVVPVYEKFLRRFPHPQTLASAGEEEVRKFLWPLGLAWRVPAFRQLARQLVEEYRGQVPCDGKALLSLPGVGEYVAGAVRCIAFDEPVVLIDVNTVRVAGRYFGFPVNAESRRRTRVKQAVTRLVDLSRPRESNLALLDFAATVCRAERPLHEQCPVADRCTWWQAELAKLRESASCDNTA